MSKKLFRVHYEFDLMALAETEEEAREVANRHLHEEDWIEADGAHEVVAGQWLSGEEAASIPWGEGKSGRTCRQILEGEGA